MAPKPSFDTSIYNMNGLLKSGWAKTGTVLIIYLSLSKACCCSDPHSKDTSFANRFVIGVAIIENP